MRFIILHKTNAHWESGALPTPDVFERVGKMIGELKEGGALLGAEGLRPSSHGARLEFAGGKRTVTPGPFQGGTKPAAGFAVIRVRSLDEAVEYASRIASAVGEAEIEVRPVTEGWDLGVSPKPEGLTTQRYLALLKSDQSSIGRAMKRWVDELARAGVLLFSERFESNERGKRLQMRAPASGAKPIVRDGPFSESKELIGGFVIIRASSLDEAARWAERYLEAVETTEVDVLSLVDSR